MNHRIIAIFVSRKLVVTNLGESLACVASFDINILV